MDTPIEYAVNPIQECIIGNRASPCCIIDLRGKGGRIGTVAVPIWVKQGIDAWIAAAEIDKGSLLRSLSKSGKMVGDELGDWAIWSVVEQSTKQIGIEPFDAHELRRTCAKLCRKNGGDLEQIKVLLGHSSIQTDHKTLSGIGAGDRDRRERQLGTVIREATPNSHERIDAYPAGLVDYVSKLILDAKEADCGCGQLWPHRPLLENWQENPAGTVSG
jgi:hypothetical protein